MENAHGQCRGTGFPAHLFVNLAGAVGQDKTGSTLDAELEKTGRYDHECVVCQKAMTRGAGDHLKSKNHWKLGKHLFEALVGGFCRGQTVSIGI